jgi:site-specific recombinase XerD
MPPEPFSGSNGGYMQDIALRDALEAFETVHMASRNLAERTRREYMNDLTDLLGFLEKLGLKRVGQVDRRHLEAYQADLDRRGYAGSTRRRRTSSLRSFFDFLKRDGYIDNNVAERLIPPKAEHRQPRVLSEREYKDLLRACAHQTRDGAIIELLLQTGVRLSELSRLTLRDIQLPARLKRSPDTVGVLHVRQGKGRRDRYVALNYKACRALKAYLKVRPDVEDDHLFISKFRSPLGPRAFQNIVKKYLEEAGIQGASVHTLRHTFATHHVAKGTSLRTVQEALGHADLKTTSMYVSLAREVMNKELQEHAL